MLRNFVADIPTDLFEAAEIDGASHFRQLMTIVVPLSGPILGTVGVMVSLSQWNEFMLPLIVMRDHARLPVMVALQRLSGEYVKFWGPLMAGYAIACVPIIALFLLSMRFFVRRAHRGREQGVSFPATNAPRLNRKMTVDDAMLPPQLTPAFRGGGHNGNLQSKYFE